MIHGYLVNEHDLSAPVIGWLLCYVRLQSVCIMEVVVVNGGMHSIWEKFAIFDQNCRLSREQCEISPWLLWNTVIGSHRQLIDPFQWFWVT